MLPGLPPTAVVSAAISAPRYRCSAGAHSSLCSAKRHEMHIWRWLRPHADGTSLLGRYPAVPLRSALMAAVATPGWEPAHGAAREIPSFPRTP